jgi:hypothetical protein
MSFTVGPSKGQGLIDFMSPTSCQQRTRNPRTALLCDNRRRVVCTVVHQYVSVRLVRSTKFSGPEPHRGNHPAGRLHGPLLPDAALVAAAALPGPELPQPCPGKVRPYERYLSLGGKRRPRNAQQRTCSGSGQRYSMLACMGTHIVGEVAVTPTWFEMHGGL